MSNQQKTIQFMLSTYLLLETNYNHLAAATAVDKKVANRTNKINNRAKKVQQ